MPWDQAAQGRTAVRTALITMEPRTRAGAARTLHAGISDSRELDSRAA